MKLGIYYLVKPIFQGNQLLFTVIIDKIENNTVHLQVENYDDWSVKTDFTEVVDVAPVIPSNPGELDQYKPIIYCFHAIRYDAACTYNYGGLGYLPMGKGQRILFNPQTGQTTTPNPIWAEGSDIGFQRDSFFDINMNPDGIKKWGSGIWTCTTDFNGSGNMRNDENPSQRITLNGLTLGNWKPYKSSVSQSFGKEKQNGRVNVTNRDPDQKVDIMHHYVGRPIKYDNGPDSANLPLPYDRNASFYKWEDVYLGSFDMVNKKHKETIAINNINNPSFEETNNVSDAWKVGSKIVLSEFEMIGKSSDVVLSEFNLIHGEMSVKYKFANNVDELKSLFTTSL
ncbi:MAG: hypothetical protein CfClM3_0795 [Methanobrevibacter sp. CfCl-M3]